MYIYFRISFFRLNWIVITKNPMSITNNSMEEVDCSLCNNSFCWTDLQYQQYQHYTQVSIIPTFYDIQYHKSCQYLYHMIILWFWKVLYQSNWQQKSQNKNQNFPCILRSFHCQIELPCGVFKWLRIELRISGQICCWHFPKQSILFGRP